MRKQFEYFELIRADYEKKKCRRLTWPNYFINDVNNTIASHDIRVDNIDYIDATYVSNLNDLALTLTRYLSALGF